MMTSALPAAVVTRKPTPIDVYVGERIRLRRQTANLTQRQLAEALGLTFQQLQKYEQGDNRISVSRLYALAQILGVSVPYFFAGLDEATVGQAVEDEQVIGGFLGTAEGLELARGFVRIERGPLRRCILDLVRALVDPDTE